MQPGSLFLKVKRKDNKKKNTNLLDRLPRLAVWH